PHRRRFRTGGSPTPARATGVAAPSGLVWRSDDGRPAVAQFGTNRAPPLETAGFARSVHSERDRLRTFPSRHPRTTRPAAARYNRDRGDPAARKEHSAPDRGILLGRERFSEEPAGAPDRRRRSGTSNARGPDNSFAVC